MGLLQTNFNFFQKNALLSFCQHQYKLHFLPFVVFHSKMSWYCHFFTLKQLKIKFMFAFQICVGVLKSKNRCFTFSNLSRTLTWNTRLVLKVAFSSYWSGPTRVKKSHVYQVTLLQKVSMFLIYVKRAWHLHLHCHMKLIIWEH